MLVERDIQTSYEEQIAAATKDQLVLLLAEVESLRLWGERWGRDTYDAPMETKDVPLLVESNGEIAEVVFPRAVWDLESANRVAIKHLDDRIVNAYIGMKKAGFQRPSSLLYGHMFKRLYNPKGLEVEPTEYDVVQWRGMILVYKRLHSTCRILFRIENEKYCRRTIYKEDGSTEIVYGKAQWRRELVARKVIKGRG